MKRFAFALLAAVSVLAVTAQQIDESRLTDWSGSGLHETLTYTQEIAIGDFNADKTGKTSCNDAFEQAVKKLGTNGGIIQFEAGTYLFTQSLKCLKAIYK